MKLSAQEVAHVAALARLKLSPEMGEKLTEQLNDILTAMDKLTQLDTSGVPSTNHALELTGAMRPDKATESLPRDEALKNAPASDGESLIVPKVI